jgi:hypothetical protein
MHGCVICFNLVTAIALFFLTNLVKLKLMFLILYCNFILIIFVNFEYSSTENYILWFRGRRHLRICVWIEYKVVKTVIKVGVIS